MKINKYILGAMVLTVLMLSIGYSAFGRKLEISDITAIVRAEADIRVTDFNIISTTASAISNYEEYNVDKLIFSVSLPNEESTVKYKVSVTNYGNVALALININNLPSNLEYELEGYTLQDIICDDNNQCSLGITKDFYITIKYKENRYNSENITYETVLNLTFSELTNEFTFDYKGEEIVYNVPYNGYYKLEIWGAQGGDSTSEQIGGYGGYSQGTIELSMDQKLYINLGGAGEYATTNNSAPGGYNGGGSCKAYIEGDSKCGSGGGASHIATKSGLLSTLSNSIDSILIVAGGGGGGNYTNDTNGGSGGHGGGMNGVKNYNLQKDNLVNSQRMSNAGTQTSAGCSDKSDSCGSFGLGGNVTNSQHNYSGSGGGGGLYGGGAANIGPGSGGSGYIGNLQLRDKIMYCYNCDSSTNFNTKTATTTNVSSSPISNYAKKGNGYAKITYLGKELNNIRITNLKVDSTTSNGNSISNTFTDETMSLNVSLPNADSTIKYKITIGNYTEMEKNISKISGLPDNLELTTTNYTINDIICNTNDDCKSGITKDFYITIKYKNNGFDSNNTNYLLDLNVTFSDLIKNYEWVYSSNGEQNFNIPYSGYYQLEVWGAQGGDSTTYIGGYGGYATGDVYLPINQKLYLNVGGAGSTAGTSKTASGGYNGGGNCKSYTDATSKCGSGGGATHIATTSGTLATLSNSIDSILIVAAGGGGGHYTNATNGGKGGHGGGFVGVDGYDLLEHNITNFHRISLGGTQETAGCSKNGVDNCGSFGLGGNITNSSDSYTGSGGGGGFYGGSGANVGPGAGGSGYIGNNALINKAMYCYNCKTSTDIATKTYSISSVSISAISKQAKTSNGHIKIKYLGKKIT